MFWYIFFIRSLLFIKCLYDYGSVEWELCDKIYINLYGLMLKGYLFALYVYV